MGVTEQTRSFRTTDAIRRWTDIEVTAIERACHQLDRRMAERGEDRDAISGTVAGMRREWRGGALLRALAERGIAGVQGSPEADAVPYPGNLTAFVPPRYRDSTHYGENAEADGPALVLCFAPGRVLMLQPASQPALQPGDRQGVTQP